VVVLSLLPGRALPAAPVSDGVAHWVAYLALAMLPVARAASPWIASVGTVMLVPLGLLLEWLQRLIPGRAFEWKDVAANAAGVMVGLALGWVVRLVWRPAAELRLSP
jgi:VanZ family protein